MLKKEVIISGLKVNYLISPEFTPDKAIVFIPGWKSPVDLFCKIMGETPNLVAINLPGWGGSEQPKAVWGLAEYAEFIKVFSEKLNINNSILIGHSVGGAMAVEYLSRGGRAKKLIIIGGAIIRERTGRSQRLFIAAKVFRFLFPFVNKKMRQRLAGKALSPDFLDSGEMEGIYKRLISEDKQVAFSKLDLPITLIWGRDDNATPYRYAERLKDLNSRVSLETIFDAGHYCFLDKPDEFRKIILNML